jgi:hypothetical protein
MHLNYISPTYHFDGLLGQEDELDDVQKGELEPPTDDEDSAPPETEADKLEDLEKEAGIRPM